MAKGRHSNPKAAAKKKERIEQQRKVDARVKIVKAANKQDDPLDALPSFKVSRRLIKFSSQGLLKKLHFISEI